MAVGEVAGKMLSVVDDVKADGHFGVGDVLRLAAQHWRAGLVGYGRAEDPAGRPSGRCRRGGPDALDGGKAKSGFDVE